MRAMVLNGFGPIEQSPLELMERAEPEVGIGQVLVKVEACGVCRTDLHMVEGELPAAAVPIVPGHQIVGRIARVAEGVQEFSEADRVGVAWLHETCGLCEFCCSERENLCRNARFTSFHVDGGFAEYAVVPAGFAYRLRESGPATEAAPLLCAGIIGYRALRFARGNGAKALGLIGFGASAHICIQVARHWGMDVFVFSRSVEHQAQAMALGAVWAGTLDDEVAVSLDGMIDFTPAGETVPAALEKLDRGGVLVLAGIHMSSVPALDYETHLYYERQIRSVTAATREDGRALLKLAEDVPLITEVEVFELAQANEALGKLKRGRIKGAAVLQIA